MIAYSKALELLGELARARKADWGSIEKRVAESVGSILGEAILSPLQVPSFANSAMDGFAVRAGELKGELPRRLRIVGTLSAGDPPISGTSSPRGVAWEIMTGAPVPESFDSVIRVEDVTVQGSEVTVLQSPREGENVRLAGEDFQLGQLVIPAGTVLCPEHVLALSALGVPRIPVKRPAQIAIVSTGQELVEPGHQFESLAGSLPAGRIYNATAPFLLAYLTSQGASARYYGVVEDRPAEFLALMERVLADAPDIVITTGAVSMGKHDFILPALGDMGADLLFHKVAVRPGKPILVARWKAIKTVFFGLPGNPVSTAVGARFFIEPYLRSVQGRAEEKPLALPLSDPYEKPAGMRCFFKGQIDASRGQVRILSGQASFMVSPLLEANGWVILGEEKRNFSAGDVVQVVPQTPFLYEGSRSL